MDVDGLHNAIMNLPCDAKEAWGQIAMNYYRMGHRDARHAAAELVVGAQPASDEVRNQALDEAIAVVPGGSYCDPQQVADAIRALKTTKGE
jgi:hypothetical protein